MNQEGRFKKQISTYLLVLTFVLGLSISIPSQSEYVHAAAKPKLNKQSVRLIKDETVKLKLKGAKGKVEWKSTKKAVASVYKKGLVKARKKGSTKIVAKHAGKSYKCKVWVETPEISKSSLELEMGQTEAINVKGTKQEVTWSSMNSEIAEVSTTGVVTATSPGNTKIMVRIGNKKYSCGIVVKSVAETPQPIGETITISVVDGRISTMHKDIPITIFNNTNETLTVCDGFGIEKKNGEIWEEAYTQMEKEEDNTEKNTYIEANTSKEVLCDIAQMGYYYDIQPGEYRVYKVIYAEGQCKVVYAEFFVEEADLDVSFELVDDEKIPYSQSSVSVVLRNNANNSVLESYYEVDKKINGVWETVGFGVDYPCVIEEIAPNEVREDEIFLGEGEYKCQLGEYRISKSVGTDEESTTLYVYFEIVE